MKYLEKLFIVKAQKAGEMSVCTTKKREKYIRYCKAVLQISKEFVSLVDLSLCLRDDPSLL